MPRETKAQRIARQEQEQLRREQELSNTYQERLMIELSEATKEGYNIGVVEGRFVVTSHIDRYVLSLQWCWKTEYALGELQSEVAIVARARAEAERQALVRANALQKLTKEERDLLGL